MPAENSLGKFDSSHLWATISIDSPSSDPDLHI
jgi:hypothetical protein